MYVCVYVPQYGSGDVSLNIYSDFVNLGGLTARVKLGVATSIDTAMQGFQSQGILGLAFAGLAEYTSPTFFDMIAEHVSFLFVLLCAVLVRYSL